MTKDRYLVFDIGATNTRLAPSNGKKIEKPLVFETPSNFSDAIEVFKKKTEELGVEVTSAAGGVAGPLDTKKEKIVNAPNLLQWNGKPLKGKLEEIFGAKVELENDTALVGLGEAVKGAGKNKGIVVYITVSTGVNGARIVDKKIDENAWGFEIGKQIIDFESKETWEGMTSGGAIEKKFDKKPEEIKIDKFWEKEAEMLAIGIYNSVLHWSPEIVILGGGMVENVSVKKVNDYLNDLPPVFEKMPSVVKAKLGHEGGLYGALQLLF